MGTPKAKSQTSYQNFVYKAGDLIFVLDESKRLNADITLKINKLSVSHMAFLNFLASCNESGLAMILTVDWKTLTDAFESVKNHPSNKIKTEFINE